MEEALGMRGNRQLSMKTLSIYVLGEEKNESRCVIRMQCCGSGGGGKGGGGEEFKWRFLVFKSAESLVFFLLSDTRMAKNKMLALAQENYFEGMALASLLLLFSGWMFLELGRQLGPISLVLQGWTRRGKLRILKPGVCWWLSSVWERRKPRLSPTNM